tara:strand:+ start:468 stop:1151 length:684 start_codon:yes stop_codon:yes gene_type:complete
MIILAKRLTEKQKKEIINLFTSGENINDLSNQFNCAKLTISRNLKKTLGEEKYKELSIESKLNNKSIISKNQNKEYSFDFKEKDNAQINIKNKSNSKISSKEFAPISQFIEITPLNCDIDNSLQKDLTSISISEINLPKTVYMIVDKKVELEIKYLRDYPRWNFLSEDELKRKTIEIYFEIKIAKSFCNKEQKVIKVPNTNVFKIAAPILISRGISRIVSSDKLIAL